MFQHFKQYSKDQEFEDNEGVANPYENFKKFSSQKKTTEKTPLATSSYEDFKQFEKKKIPQSPPPPPPPDKNAPLSIHDNFKQFKNFSTNDDELYNKPINSKNIELQPYKGTVVNSWESNTDDFNINVNMSSPSELQKFEALEEEEDIQDQKSLRTRFCTRVFICVIAVALIWSTSLQLCSTVPAYFLPMPDIDAVIDRWSSVLDVVMLEKDMYKSCAVSQIASCNRILNSSISGFRAAQAQLKAENQQKLDDAGMYSQNCSMQLIIIQDAINNFLVSTNMVIGVNNTCTAADKNLTAEIIGGGQVRTNSFLESKQYSQEETSLWSLLDRQIEARRAYDAAYLANKTGFLSNLKLGIGGLPDVYFPDSLLFNDLTIDLDLAIDASLSCATFTSNNCTLGGFESIAEKYNAMQDFTKQKYTEALMMYDNWKENALQYKAQVDDMLPPIQNFLETCWEFADYLPFDIDIIPSVETPELDIYTPNFDLRPLGEFPSDLFPTGADLANIASPAVAYMQLMLMRARQKIINATVDMGVNLDMELGSLPDVNANFFQDYDPPEVSVDMEEVERRQSRFLTLQALSTRGIEIPSYNVTRNESYYSQFKELSSSFSFESSLKSFKAENLSWGLSIAPILAIFDNIAFLSYFCDYLWRGLRTIRTILRFWTASLAFLPTIDARQFSTGPSERNELPLYLRIPKLITHQNIMKLLLAGFLIFCTVYIVAVYIAFYQEHVEGCVKNDQFSGPGTTITNNAYAIAFNWAGSDGNKKLAEGFVNYDSQRGEICGSDAEKAQTNEDDTQGLFNAYTLLQEDTAFKLDLISRCIDRDSYMNASYFMENSGGYPPPDIMALNLLQGGCHATALSRYILTSDPYSCNLLPVCDTTCELPSDTVKTVTHYGGCVTEWWVHARLLRLIFSLLIYACVNVSAWIFVTALCRVFWKSLSPHGFTFMGTCTREGRIKLKTLKELKTKISETISQYELIAILLFIVALIVHIPYILGLMYAAPALSSENV